MIRIGHGFDVHKFGGLGPIVMGGVKIPHDQGLIAHSDGDVALHALCDAILGALALGDIGTHFPDNSDQYADIDSRELLLDVFNKAQQRGYKIGNADLTIVAQVPKMSPFITPICVQIASLLQTSTDNINVKATTTENLGYVGRSEGIAVHAVVLLIKDEKK